MKSGEYSHSDSAGQEGGGSSAHISPTSVYISSKFLRPLQKDLVSICISKLTFFCVHFGTFNQKKGCQSFPSYCRLRQLGTKTVKFYINLQSLLTSVGCVPGKPATRVASVIVPVKLSTLNLRAIFRHLSRFTSTCKLTRICWLCSRETCNTSSLSCSPSKARQLELISIFQHLFLITNLVEHSFITPRLLLEDQKASREVRLAGSSLVGEKVST